MKDGERSVLAASVIVAAVCLLVVLGVLGLVVLINPIR